MAMMAKDGTRHHSASRASLHDSLSANKGDATKNINKGEAGGDPAKAAKAPAIPQNHPHMPGPHQTPTETPIEEHVQEHGPATHHGHMEDPDTGMHHVTTHHGAMGKNMHHSEHDSHHEAHEHIGKAMEIHGTDESEAGETPDEENAEHMLGGGKGSSSIPGIG